MEHISLENNVLFPRALAGSDLKAGWHCAIQHDNAVISAFSSPLLTNKQPAQPQSDKPRGVTSSAWRVSSSSVSSTTTTQRMPYIPSTSACRAASCRLFLMQVRTLFAIHQVRAKDNLQTNINRIAETVVIIVNAPIRWDSHTASPRRRAGRCRRRSPFRGYGALREFSERFRCHTSCARPNSIRLVEKTPLLAEERQRSAPQS